MIRHARELAAPLALAAFLAGCDSKETTCGYAGRAYAAGASFPATDGCNTCQCAADGTVDCTLAACLGDASFVPPADSSMAGDAAVVDSTCALPSTLTFGLNGGMVLYQDENVLDPKTGLTITRSYYGRSAIDGAAMRTCSPALPACGATGVVSLSTIIADLAASDAQTALASGKGTLYGGDPRPVDGTVYSIALASGGSILVGSPCSSASTTCVPIPAGVQRLADDLKRLASAAAATAECQDL